MNNGPRWTALCFVVAILLQEPLSADTLYWTGGSNDWFNSANWTPPQLPAGGDDIIVTNAGSFVLLTNSTPYLASLSLSRTILFSNWNTTLSATNITILSTGILTLPAAFTNNVMSNNIVLACSNFFLASGGTLAANSKGYARGGWIGNGPGGGTNFPPMDGYQCTGPGHGGRGGRWQLSPSYGQTYGSELYPDMAGSGGEPDTLSTDGGGAVRISADGTVTVNGTITANGGAPGAYGSGGAGGSIWITCRVFGGTNGSLSANGGNANTVNSSGGGGGGRIAVHYDPASQAGAPVSLVRCSATGGSGTRLTVYGAPGIGNPDGYAEPGTVYFPSPHLLNSNLLHSGRLVIPGFTSWSVPSLLVSNAWAQLPEGFALTVTNDIRIYGSSARLTLPSSTLQCGGALTLDQGDLDFDAQASTGRTVWVGGDIILTNSGAELYVRGGITNEDTPDWGALVSVGGSIRVYSNAVIRPWSNPTNGGSPLFRAKSILIAGGGLIDASYVGFQRGTASVGYGPGGGRYVSQYNTGGGGHGGRGGRYTTTAGLTYGDSNAPVTAGSGGGGTGIGNIYRGQDGGGLVRLEASSAIHLFGAITANGGYAGAYGGGGAGGGVYLRSHVFTGTNGSISAAGGSADLVNSAGGGGGGRVAIWRTYDLYGGTCSINVNGATGTASIGEAGTICFGWIPAPGTIITLR